MGKDSVFGTISVAIALCVICSVLVSGAAVGLKPLQVENQKLDIKKNLLIASGLLENPSASKEEIEEVFKKIKTSVIDLSTGEVVDMDPETFDAQKAAKDPSQNHKIDAEDDVGAIRVRAQYSKVYEVMDGEEVTMIVLPVFGKGLWSTMYGFVAISPDTETIKGLGFYAHGETPGLGGEIENPRWLEIWEGKKTFDEEYNPQIEVVKGSVDSSTPNAQYKVDGLSGATITSKGVSGMMRYWLGSDAFGPYLEKVRENLSQNTEMPSDEVQSEASQIETSEGVI